MVFLKPDREGHQIKSLCVFPAVIAEIRGLEESELSLVTEGSTNLTLILTWLY